MPEPSAAKRRGFLGWLLHFATTDRWAIFLIALMIYALGQAVR